MFPIPNQYGINDLDIQILALQDGLIKFAGYLGESFMITIDELEQVKNTNFLQLRQDLSVSAFQYKQNMFP